MVNSGPISDRILFSHLRNCSYTIRLSRIGNKYPVRIGNKYPVRIGNTYPARIQNTCQHIVDHPSPSLSRSPYHPNAMHHHPHILQEPSRPRLQKIRFFSIPSPLSSTPPQPIKSSRHQTWTLSAKSYTTWNALSLLSYAPKYTHTRNTSQLHSPSSYIPSSLSFSPAVPASALLHHLHNIQNINPNSQIQKQRLPRQIS